MEETELDIALIGLEKPIIHAHLSKESMEDFLKHIYFAEETSPDTTYTIECINIKCNFEPGNCRKKRKKHKGGNMFHK